MLAEIGDISRFANGSSLASYAGPAPATRQSGSSPRADPERGGIHRLKNATYLSAFASLRDPASRASYDCKRAEGKRHTAAVICLARRRSHSPVCANGSHPANTSLQQCRESAPVE